MKRQLFLSALILLTIFSSCHKDAGDYNQSILGKWVWTNSTWSENDGQMLPNDTTNNFFIQFNSDNSFVNEARCIMGGPSSGQYRVTKVGENKVVLLIGTNYQPDTLRLLNTASVLVLSETYGWHMLNHYFDKK